ncbi:MAG: PrsW family intramembrane metalloprotease [Treponema sp.]|jgi:RsiW-degrading membrane proteinase PrsW (M82 family)|nr:PrsW family intramembrane metalloprotease [Treponema sp.]
MPAWFIVLLIFISSLPLIAVFIWFKLAKYQFSIYRFLFTLLAGATAVFPAIILQRLLDFSFYNSRAAIFFHHFINTALTEELSRLLVLLVLFWISARILDDRLSISTRNQPPSLKIIKKATASGLIAGLGFALLENAVYAASDINVLPFRIILTTAIHGACGSRIGAAAVTIRSNPVRATMRILTATAIHGIYNLLVDIPGISQITAILIAVSAFLTTILTIRGGWLGENSENLQNSP